MDKPEVSGKVISIPSDAIYLADVDDFVYEIFGKAGLSKSSIADFAISVSEIVNNAIAYGSGGDSSSPVTVKIEVSRNEASICIQDKGPGFNPDSLPDPLDKDNLLKQVGRGIFIVRSLMTSVDFNITDDGTEVVLKKSINE
ncbi:MAG: ATP-binding protein [candidate division Zixibacteria bacterium]|nr:ATP-binding protein [candidate division Zixibacteria bacterium]